MYTTTHVHTYICVHIIYLCAYNCVYGYMYLYMCLCVFCNFSLFSFPSTCTMWMAYHEDLVDFGWRPPSTDVRVQFFRDEIYRSDPARWTVPLPLSLCLTDRRPAYPQTCLDLCLGSLGREEGTKKEEGQWERDWTHVTVETVTLSLFCSTNTPLLPSFHKRCMV